MVGSEFMVALGCAPHSGWAAAVAVCQFEGSARVLLRERIEMASPHEPTARQPYHNVAGLPTSEAAKRLAAYEASASMMAQRAFTTIAGRLADGGQELRWVSILESAGRKGSSLAATLASHALIHTADGDHFRTALAAAAEKCGLSVHRVAARTLETEAAAALGRPPSVCAK